MIPIGSIYNDVADVVNKDENSNLTYEMFNRMSRRGELRLLDWITGKVTGQIMPQYLMNQKNRDWTSPLLNSYPTVIDAKGIFEKPDDYYYYDNLYELNLTDTSCEEDKDCDNINKVDEVGRFVIDILSGDKFNQRINTKIKKLKPRPKRAIAKEIGNTFELYPVGLQGVVLEYIKRPVFATIVSTVDPTFNTEVIDDAASTNYMWNEMAREALIFFISDSFINHTTAQSSKQFNNASNQELAGK